MTQVTVRHDPGNSRYTAYADGELAGHTQYQVVQGRYIFVHTEVDPSYTGKGVGNTLIKEALDDVRAGGGTIVPLCPFVAAFVRRHSDYRDLVDRGLWKRITRSERPDQ